MPRKSRFVLPPLDPTGKTLGERLRETRKERGYTQVELAQKVGITQGLVSDYELDKLRLTAEMAARFALALGVEVGALLGVGKTKGNGRKLNRRILRRLQQIDALPPEHQRALIKTIDTYLKGAQK